MVERADCITHTTPSAACDSKKTNHSSPRRSSRWNKKQVMFCHLLGFRHTLLAEFYSDDAVRARAKSAALAEGKLHYGFVFVRHIHNCVFVLSDMNPEERKSSDQVMVAEISSARMTITEKTARNWLRKLGFKFRTKVR